MVTEVVVSTSDTLGEKSVNSPVACMQRMDRGADRQREGAADIHGINPLVLLLVTRRRRDSGRGGTSGAMEASEHSYNNSPGALKQCETADNGRNHGSIFAKKTSVICCL